MALVCFVKEGASVTSGESHELSLPECMEKLKLKKGAWISKLNNGPGGNEGNDYHGFQRVFVKVDDTEANEQGWKSGFYFVDVSVKNAKQLLGLT